MAGKRATATLLGLSLGAVAAVAPTAAPGGATHKSQTVAFVADGGGDRYDSAKGRGGAAAAKALGIHFLYRTSGKPYNGVYKALIARHVAAISTGGYDPSMKPYLGQVLAAHIPLLSAGDDIAGRRTVWVNGSDAATYAQALADAVASQMNGQGEYAILGEQGQFPVADQWTQQAKAYIAKAYPGMTLDGVVTETGAGDPAEESAVEDYLTAHPNLKGLIGIVPTEAWMAAEAITKTGKIGKVFSAGNGGGDINGPLPAWVRSGAAQFVFNADPVKIGYLTMWAAHWLITGHRFKPGAYQVGGPIGLVRYYAQKQELRLGHALTITKANIDGYANTF